MSHPIIKVENLSKSYIINHEGQRGGYTAMRDVISQKAKKIFSFPQKLETNAKRTEEFFALKDLNFEINQGDRVGIIGRNGAGKSTLLKILSRITEPTSGSIRIKGRVASLLEVGTGFHPELTGRENIYLNGAILGMSRSEIKRKFDEIVDFAEVERFLDTPVKRYSSGMYVRLAFSVAAHLEPEILIVDEVLAVGDAQFQKKCLGKMEQVSLNEGRTVLFVSHNIDSIRSICENGIILDLGQLEFIGKVDLAVKKYIQKAIYNKISEGELGGVKFSIVCVEGLKVINEITIENDVFVKIEGEGLRDKEIGFTIFDDNNVPIISSSFQDFRYEKNNLNKAGVKIPIGLFQKGDFRIEARVDNFQSECVITFNKILTDSIFLENGNNSKGLLMATKWENLDN